MKREFRYYVITSIPIMKMRDNALKDKKIGISACKSNLFLEAMKYYTREKRLPDAIALIGCVLHRFLLLYNE